MSALGFSMCMRHLAGRVVAIGLAFAILGTEAFAQSASEDAGAPVGATWNAQVSPAPVVAGIALDPGQLSLVEKVSSYFNDLHNLKGAFVQTGPDKKRMRGRFYVKKPGRLRFEYALPSKQLIISDGEMVAIQDLDINTDDRMALNQTPFRVLLGKDVDLLRDARILEVQESEDLAIVTLQDKNPEAVGRIRLFMSKLPKFELKEWVTTDAQGLDTRLEVSGLITDEVIDLALFRITSPHLKNLQKNQ